MTGGAAGAGIWLLRDRCGEQARGRQTGRARRCSGGGAASRRAPRWCVRWTRRGASRTWRTSTQRLRARADAVAVPVCAIGAIPPSTSRSTSPTPSARFSSMPTCSRRRIVATFVQAQTPGVATCSCSRGQDWRRRRYRAQVPPQPADIDAAVERYACAVAAAPRSSCRRAVRVSSILTATRWRAPDAGRPGVGDGHQTRDHVRVPYWRRGDGPRSRTASAEG